MAAKNTANIKYDKLPSRIPLPKKPHVKYPGRNYAYFERGQNYKIAKELYDRLLFKEAKLKGFG